MNASLQTPRLVLRPVDASDRALYVALYTDPKVMRDIAPALSAERATRAFDVVLLRADRPFPSDRYWVVCLPECNQGIGLVALQVDGRRGEWGVILHPAHQSCGYASETLAAITAAAFDSGAVDRMTIRCSPGLARRIGRIARAGGYRPSGTFEGLMLWACP